MKILAIGDFHGKFPEKLKKRIRKEKPDLILGTGDYADADKIRKIVFKNWTNKKWYDVVGLKKAEELEKNSYNSGLKILREINSLGKPVCLIWGNTDFYEDYTIGKPPIKIPGFYNERIKKMKNLILIERKKKELKEIEIIGHGGYVDVTDFIKHPIDKDKKNQKKRLARYKRDEKILYELFRKKKPKNFIFMIHYAPFKCLDKVKYKSSPMHGKNVGFEPYNNIIKKYKPALVVCGHMHENQGSCKIGKTLVINPGAANEGRMAIIEFDERKKKVENVKFVR
jgi:Icc-related predicted phosphoesterase